MQAVPLAVGFDPLENTLKTRDNILEAVRVGAIKLLGQQELDQILSEQTKNFSSVAALRTGTKLIPTADGLAVELHPDLQRRAPHAVVSSRVASFDPERSYPSRFACQFYYRARSMLKVLMRGMEDRRDPETAMVATLLNTNIDGGAVLVVAPKYLAYTLKAGSILQGISDKAVEVLLSEEKLQGIIMEVPLFRDKHALAIGKHPEENWEQVVVHTGEKNFPVIYAFTEYPGPSLKKALYAICMYLCSNDIVPRKAKFPFHGSAAVIKTPEKNLTLATFGASGAGKTETWFNPIYLAGVAEKAGISPDLICDLWAESAVLKTVDRSRVDIKILPAGDDILLIDANEDGKLTAKNIEQDGIFLRPDGEEAKILPQLMAGKGNFVFLNYIGSAVRKAVNLLNFEPNPRIFYSTDAIPDQQMKAELKLDVLNLGIRCSASTADHPGLCIGLVHRVSPNMLRVLNCDLMRASKGNPSIVGTSEDIITGEGPGSVLGFLTPESAGNSFQAMDRVLRKISDETLCVLTASQNIGAEINLGFAGQQALTLNLSQSEGNLQQQVSRKDLIYSGHPLLGHIPKSLLLQKGVAGEADIYADQKLLHPWKQEQLGVDGWFKSLNVINDFYLRRIRYLLEHFSADLDDEIGSMLKRTEDVLIIWKHDIFQKEEKGQLAKSIVEPDGDYYIPRQEAVYELLDKKILLNSF